MIYLVLVLYFESFYHLAKNLYAETYTRSAFKVNINVLIKHTGMQLMVDYYYLNQ